MKTRTAGTAVVALLLAAGCRTPLDTATLKPNRTPAAPAKNDAEFGELPALAKKRSSQRSPKPTDALLRQTAAEQPVSPVDQLEETLSLGHLAMSQGRMADAERLYGQVLALDPEHPAAHHRLAVFADQRQDYRAAEQHYAVALAGMPHDADLLNDMGYSALLQARTPEAEAYLQEALHYDPSHPRALKNFASLLEQTGRQQQAQRLLAIAGGESAPIETPAASGPPAGTDPTLWLREQMDRARQHDIERRQQRTPTATAAAPNSYPAESYYAEERPASYAAQPASVAPAWNTQPTEPPPYYYGQTDPSAGQAPPVGQAPFAGQSTTAGQLPNAPAAQQWNGPASGATQREMAAASQGAWPAVDPRTSAGPVGEYPPTTAAYGPSAASAAAPPAAAAPGAMNWQGTAGPQITPGEAGSGLRRPTASTPASGPADLTRGGGLNYGPAPAAQDARSLPSQPPVASWSSSPIPQGPQAPPAPHVPGAGLGDNTRPFPAPQWPAQPQWPTPTSPPGSRGTTSQTSDAVRAAQLGLSSGPGQMFSGIRENQTTLSVRPTSPGIVSAGYEAQPGASASPVQQMSYEQHPAWPHTNGGAAPQESIEQFQQSVRRQYDEVEQVRRQLEAARQLPAGGGAPRPAQPQGYNSLPSQGQYSTPQQWSPPSTPAGNGGTYSAPAAPMPTNYNPAPYAPAPYDAARR